MNFGRLKQVKKDIFASRNWQKKHFKQFGGYKLIISFLIPLNFDQIWDFGPLCRFDLEKV